MGKCGLIATGVAQFMERRMSYTLEAFCADCRRILKADPSLSKTLPEIGEQLKRLLRDEDFVAATFEENMPPSKRVLYHDPETGFYVNAHVQPAGKGGAPHNHGASWAIYGNALGYTEMTEWRRVNSDSEDHAVLEASDEYRLGPGQTRAYGPGVIHSTNHPNIAWVIRLTGTDLDKIPRYHFRPKSDKKLEKARSK